MVDVAQLVESRIVIPVVVGSSPIVHPRMLKARIRFGLFYCLLPVVLYKQTSAFPLYFLIE